MQKNKSAYRHGYKPYKELSFTDDFMFRKILMNDENLCKELVELLLDVRIKRIKYKEDNHEISIRPDSKGVRLDVYLEDEEGTVFDLEMQNAKQIDLSRRARYYQSVIDINHLSSGEEYERLPDSYIVFICTFDPFVENRHKYEFRELCVQNAKLRLDSGTAKVFINAKGTKENASQDMQAFLDYLCGMGASSKLTRSIESGLFSAKGRKPWEVEYMTLYDKIRLERKEERAWTKTQDINALVDEGILDVERACEILKMPYEDYLRYMEEYGEEAEQDDQA